MKRVMAAILACVWASVWLITTGASAKPLPVPTDRIAFASDRDSLTSPSTQIYLVNADGTDLTKLTNFSWWAITPTWSPDGTRIVFTGVRPEAFFKGAFVPFKGRPKETAHAHDIYVMNPDGSHVQNLTSDDRANDSYPAWSPDGTAIAFTRGCDPVNCNAHIAVMSTDGSNIVEITSGPNLDFRPTWSPDSSKIAFERDAPDFTSSGVYVVNRNGTGLTKLVGLPAGFGEDSAWSPDGTKIAFWNAAIPALQTVNVTTKKVTTLVVAADLGPGDTAIRYASWSPDGQWLAIAADGEGSDGAALVLVSADGKTILPVPNGHAASGPSWQPTGAL